MSIHQLWQAKLQTGGPFAQDILLLGDGSVRPGLGLEDILDDIARTHPGGVNTILIGPSSRAGWTVVHQGNGIIAILIGLLLPAVQNIGKSGGGNSTGKAFLSFRFGTVFTTGIDWSGPGDDVLARGGKVFVAGENGEFLPAI